ncbi:hypothetical protein PR202_ga14729 [Eleusine coracana subsp. coracana]|uniref:Uncharacterized protein n=1 Tax=Eleusine coracana subsp. coracana TaxID=191504 RepID=A0AAV5CH80_ELECO|nr:hypothetical protein PR202_ga14729 [Eleusine coracana subsp. coracana]
MTQRLEEAIDGAMARMAEPDWTPFRPGTSYFVPPRPAGAARGLLALLGHGGGMELAPLRRGLSVDEVRAVASSRGYPCSTYFIDGKYRLLELMISKLFILHGEFMNMQATFQMKWRAQSSMPIKLKRNESKGLPVARDEVGDQAKGVAFHVFISLAAIVQKVGPMNS